MKFALSLLTLSILAFAASAQAADQLAEHGKTARLAADQSLEDGTYDDDGGSDSGGGRNGPDERR